MLRASSLFILPVSLLLLSSPTKMHRCRKSFSSCVSQHVQDLDVDTEATNKRKAELSRECEKTEADTKASSPVFTTAFNAIIDLPLYHFVDLKRADSRMVIYLHIKSIREDHDDGGEVNETDVPKGRYLAI